MIRAVVVTVYRRYHELGRSLRLIREAADRGEFGCRPRVLVVWADPEDESRYLFRWLLRDALVASLLTRDGVPEDGAATTYPESLNLRVGLTAARGAFGPEAAVVCMSADVYPEAGTFAFVNKHLNDHDAVVFHWPCEFTRQDVWHTNFFGVRLDPAYWPPVSDPFNADVLEAQWGCHLRSAGLPRIFRSHNYQNKRFTHQHTSEDLPPLPPRRYHPFHRVADLLSGVFHRLEGPNGRDEFQV